MQYKQCITYHSYHNCQQSNCIQRLLIVLYRTASSASVMYARNFLVSLLMVAILSIAYYYCYYRTESKSQGTLKFSPVPIERKIILHLNGYRYSKVTEFIDDGEYKCLLQHGGTEDDKRDLVVFDDIDVKHYKTVPKKLPHDIWAFYGKEPQTKVGRPQDQNKWDGMFNYSATFHRNNEANSHIFRAQLMGISPPNTHYFRPKPKMLQLRALWFVSHCTSPTRHREIQSAREEYVLELSKYIHIDVYTSEKPTYCADKLGSLVKDSSIDGEPKMEDYMFYLSFENNLCRDYITEKLWKVLESNSTTIPIALGGLSIEDYEYVAPPHSFIHVRNFTSPEALASHLKFVSQDDNAFHYYNQWRNEFWLKTRHVYHPREGYYYCDFFEYICKLIYERPQKVWHTFSKDFNANQCKVVPESKDYCTYYNFSCNH